AGLMDRGKRAVRQSGLKSRVCDEFVCETRACEWNLPAMLVCEDRRLLRRAGLDALFDLVTAGRTFVGPEFVLAARETVRRHADERRAAAALRASDRHGPRQMSRRAERRHVAPLSANLAR